MRQVIIETLQDLWTFWKNPVDEKIDLPSQAVWRFLLALLVIDVVVMVILSLPISLLESLEILDAESHKVVAMMEDLSPLVILLLTVLVAPIIEEVLFRGFITFRRAYPVHLLFAIAELLNKNRSEETRRIVWNRNFKWVIITSSILFGLVHLSNFESSTRILLLFPVLIAPQTVLGFFLAVLRIRFGFRWCAYFHALHNFVFVGTALLVQNNDSLTQI